MRRNTNLNKQQTKQNYIIQGWMQIRIITKKARKLLLQKSEEWVGRI